MSVSIAPQLEAAETALTPICGLALKLQTSRSLMKALSPHTLFPGGSVPTAEHRQHDWLRHIGLLNDYVRIPYANGSSFASQFLHREFSLRGSDVTVVGPSDPDAMASEMPPRHVCLPSVPLRNHPGVRLPMPSPKSLSEIAAQRFDLVLGQTSTELLDLGVWLRQTQHVPFLGVNTVHLPSAYNVLLPDSLAENPMANELFKQRLVPWVEERCAQTYNQSDGLIVLARGLERYWRERGVVVPIHVIPRSVDPKIFDRESDHDPFDPRATRGQRLLVVCRHTREKEVERLLTLFAMRIAPHAPEATLTLVGDGPDHDRFRRKAKRLGVAERCFFPGEFPLTDMAAFYRHADVFVYTSLSETYGQVVSEAMWCGLAVVAFADEMGVSHQVQDGLTGHLVAPGPNRAEADAEFAGHVLRLLSDDERRLSLANRARQASRFRVHPNRIVDRYYEAFEHAREHCKATAQERASHPFAAMSTIGRWAAVQSLVFGLGCIRPPSVVNRHRRGQPGWGALPAEGLSQPQLRVV